ncbi:MAG TPA: DNA repair protein RecN [Actinomycetota bacterium]|nr:DNA repair protein RecN [Actinomycetota bacterium]
MLRQLHITGLGVIHELDIEPAPGLTVLTGETGAGKTMIATGISLAIGARGGAHLVRAGDGAAKIQARFDAPDGAEEWAEDGEVILARSIAADGRGSARIGGQLTTAAALDEMGARLVEIHGQHGSLRLLDGATQTQFLDRAAGPDQIGRAVRYREAYERLLERRRTLAALTEAARDRERQIDLLAYQVREIESVGPVAGETLTLEAEEARLGHAERLRDLAESAVSAIADDGGAADLFASSARDVSAIAAVDPQAGALGERAAALAAEVSDLASELRAYRERVALDPERLSEVRDRTAALKGLHRKYGATDNDVLIFLDQARTELASLQTADERLASIGAEVDEATGVVTSLADELHRVRLATAPDIAQSLCGHLADLGMPGASIEIGVSENAEPGPAGTDRVEMRFRGGTGQPAAPLAKVASGGELSRVMLACRSVLAALDDVPTLVFDEIDAGIGGEAGLAVGRRLARLATTHQVLVVTHLPQIACFADLHVGVRKRDGAATARVLDGADRVAELSRMLAGMEASEHALSHAEELLVEARRLRAEAR